MRIMLIISIKMFKHSHDTMIRSGLATRSACADAARDKSGSGIHAARFWTFVVY